ncbi:putative protein OS=Streptomyces microflavus OX=1919 GN=Smic_63290 PE=4 SV=1 [Streptomyces microflavus]
MDDATTVLPTVDPGGVPEVVPDAESTRQLRPADPDRTQLLDLGDARTRMLRAQPGAGAGSDPDRTQLLPQAPSGLAGTGAPSTGAGSTEGTTQGTRLRGWKRPALAAAAVFAVSMAGITAFEMISGNDLSGGQGTTLGSVVRGGGDRDQGPADPTPSGDTGRDGGDGQQDPGDGNGSAPATDPGDGSTASPDPGTGTGGENPSTGTTPTPTPSHSGGGTTPAPTPTPSTPGDGGTGAPDPTGTGGAPGQGEQAPPADGTGAE